MSTAVKKSDREHVLSELEKYYTDKLVSVQAKRRGIATFDRPREIVIGGAVNLTIDPGQRKVILCWDK